jgi:hypothetical protein
MSMTFKVLQEAVSGNRLALNTMLPGVTAADALAPAWTITGTNNDVLGLTNGAFRVTGEVVGGKIVKGIHIGPATSIYGQVSLRGSVAGNYSVSESVYGFHGFEDYSTVNMTGDGSLTGKNAYASVAISAATSGTANYDHFKSVQAWAGHGSSGTMGEFYGVDVYSSLAGGTTTNNFGLRIRAPGGAGTITNNYGIYIDEQGRGGTKDYSIYCAGNANSFFKGDVVFGVAGCTSHLVTLTNKFLWCSDSQSKFGDAGLCAGGSASGHTTLEYYSANTFTIKRGTTTVATFGGDSSLTLASLAGTGSRTVVADANGKLSAP